MICRGVFHVVALVSKNILHSQEFRQKMPKSESQQILQRLRFDKKGTQKPDDHHGFSFAT